jgi:hypothetical protein
VCKIYYYSGWEDGKYIFAYKRIRKKSKNNMKTQREHCSAYA